MQKQNSGGVRGITIRRDFDCFDRLPESVRRALAEANNKYCSVQLYSLWQSGSMTAAELVGELKNFERQLERQHQIERERECAREELRALPTTAHMTAGDSGRDQMLARGTAVDRGSRARHGPTKKTKAKRRHVDRTL